MSTPSSIETFIETIRSEYRRFFDNQHPIALARAPLSLEVLGGSASFAGALVLGFPLSNAVFVALQPDPEPLIRVVVADWPAAEDGSGERSNALNVALPLTTLAPGGTPIEYQDLQSVVAGVDGSTDWALVALGCWLVLMREEFVSFAQGARMLICTTVSTACGLNPTAALAAATMQALTTMGDIRIDPRELALLCWRAEQLTNVAHGAIHVVTATKGTPHHLVPLLCQNYAMPENIALPDHLTLWGIAVGQTQSASPPNHHDLHTSALMGYRMIADQAGLPAEHYTGSGQTVMRISDRRWRGFLANISPSEFARAYNDALPKQMGGADFLARYGGITDPRIQIDPTRSYPIRSATAHVIHEHFRARTFAHVLRSTADTPETATILGELMNQSPASYAGGAGEFASAHALVSMMQETGPSSGVYGARITDTGMVAVLGHTAAGTAVQAIAEQFAAQTGVAVPVLRGSLVGASDLGTSWFVADQKDTGTAQVTDD